MLRWRAICCTCGQSERPGKITDEDNQESDVLFRRNGEWKVVFLHYSSAPKK